MMRTIVLTYFGPVLVDYRPLFLLRQVSASFKASGKLLVIANVSEC